MRRSLALVILLMSLKHIIMGLIAEAYGLEDEAIQAYHMAEPPPYQLPTSSYTIAQSRLQALLGK